jgi:hypothetical protein
MTVFHKIKVLEKAAAGDVLTQDEEETLRDCADDYRPLIRLGNGFKIAKHHVIEAFEIIFEDVHFMAGSRRQRAIRLLKLSGARGYREEDLPVPIEHPTDERLGDQMAVPITPEEIREAG